MISAVICEYSEEEDWLLVFDTAGSLTLLELQKHSVQQGCTVVILLWALIIGYLQIALPKC